MKALFLIGAAVLLIATSVMMHSSHDVDANDNLYNSFQMWKEKHNKRYASREEESYRFQVWLSTVKYINENQGDTYTLGVNQFSDLTNEEWKGLYLLPKGVIQNFHTEETAIEFPQGFQAPTTVNWENTGKVNSILNQGQCGSCWAFSTVESINSAYAVNLNTSPIPNLSEQQVVSCSILYGNMGCGGGNVVPAYKYVLAHPLTTNTQYPYVSGTTTKTGVCNSSLASQGTWKITGYKTVPTNDCDTLQNTVATQPTSVCVDASTWQNYQSGIFSNCGTQLDHCVLAVGYVQGSYWEIQNQWSTDWGMNGLIQLKWGNTCGVCQQAQIPTV